MRKKDLVRESGVCLIFETFLLCLMDPSLFLYGFGYRIHFHVYMLHFLCRLF